CVTCEQEAIKDAYHGMCNRCTRESNVCAKCQESREIVLTISEQRRGSSQNRSSSSVS
ncbi:hypothetical protein K457DRAFT_67668, partial [Linnemannia elongata AG-77]